MHFLKFEFLNPSKTNEMLGGTTEIERMCPGEGKADFWALPYTPGYFLHVRLHLTNALTTHLPILDGSKGLADFV